MDNVAQETTFETFDSFEETSSEGEDTNEDWGSSDSEEVEEHEEDEGLKLLDDTDVDGDGDVVDKEGKKETKVKKFKKEVEEEDSEEEEVLPLEENEDNKVPEDKAASKKIRIRQADGDLYNIDSDSTVPVKVDGKVEDVNIQELINNYSGKTAWDKKFTELGKEKKTLEFEKAQVVQKSNLLQEHVQKAIAPLKDPEKNPLDSMLYLVEMSGEDPYAAYRRIMEANLEELSSLMDMSEVERELYFHKKKDELHSKVAKQRNERVTKDQAFNQVVEKVNALRQAHNVTEDDFVDASDELESLFKAQGLDAESITEEQVVDYASLKPHIVTVKELIEPYEQNISESKYGEVVAQLSRYLRDGKSDKEGISQLLKRNFSVEESVKELNSRVYRKGSTPSKVAQGQDSDGSESFDDL